MTPERAQQIDQMLLDSLKDRPRYLDFEKVSADTIERCEALKESGQLRIEKGWVSLRKPEEEPLSKKRY